MICFRQLCVDEQSRGSFIQEGGFKVCSEISVKDSETSTARMEAAHAIAKSLVTTNPHIINEHQRLGAIRPLLFLCKYVFIFHFYLVLFSFLVLVVWTENQERRNCVNLKHYYL